jgi:acyl carrier protein
MTKDQLSDLAELLAQLENVYTTDGNITEFYRLEIEKAVNVLVDYIDELESTR